jgi:flagellar basal-body rod protein FlgB
MPPHHKDGSAARISGTGAILPPTGKRLPHHTARTRRIARLRQLARGLLIRTRNLDGAMQMSGISLNESLFGIHGAALELRSQRMGLITSNIANAATPGYKARDIDFAAALKARIGGASADKAVETATRYRVPVMPSLDGNTVELGSEQVAFSQNAVSYSATLSFIRGRVDTITRALKGD